MVEKKYKFPVEIFRDFGDALPKGIHLGYIDDNLIDCYVTPREISNLRLTGINLDIISQAKYQKQFDEWIEQYAIYPFKIYKWLSNKKVADTYAVPYDIDFTTDLSIMLHKKLLPKVKGKPTSCEYYEKKQIRINNGQVVYDASGNPIIDYTNLVCKIVFELSYDVYGFIIQRKEKLYWAKEDGSFSTEYKDIGRIFDPVLDHEARIQEGKERRGSIVDNIQLPIFGMLKMIFTNKTATELLLMGRDFLAKYDQDFRDFVNSSLSVSDINSPDFNKKVIYVKIRDASETWLDSQVPTLGITIRQYLLNEFTNI